MQVPPLEGKPKARMDTRRTILGKIEVFFVLFWRVIGHGINMLPWQLFVVCVFYRAWKVTWCTGR